MNSKIESKKGKKDISGLQKKAEVISILSKIDLMVRKHYLR